MIVKSTGRVRDRNRCTGRLRSKGIGRVKGRRRGIGWGSGRVKGIGRGTGKGSGRIKGKIEVLVIEEVFILDCSKNVEVLVGRGIQFDTFLCILKQKHSVNIA